MSTTTTGLEYIRCNLCGSNDPALLFEVPVRPDQEGQFAQDVWNIVRCRNCQLVYVNPRPDTIALKEYYTFSNPVDMAFIQGWFIQNADLNRVTWQRYLRAIRRFCPSGSLLDVGCGAGSFLITAQEAGFQVLGQEISDYFVEFCRNKLALPVMAGELETLDLAPASFDCVTAFDVIEHHPDPQRLLHTMHWLLKPGGLAVISTHDIGNFFARFYGPRWRHIAPIGHLTYFTRSTLAEMLMNCGFQVVYQGGMHTIDGHRRAEVRNYLTQFLRVVLLRALVLGIYKPISARLPAMTRWQVRWQYGLLNHEKLLLRAGEQIVMNDDMVLLARALPPEA
ncbi:MAG: class I SAM-dependent methyltransferase [Anaerolineae bacterium]